MEVKIQAIHFDATEKLQEFIEKKVAKFGKFSEEIRKVEVSLKVVKPETSMNKRHPSRFWPRQESFSRRKFATHLKKQ